MRLFFKKLFINVAGCMLYLVAFTQTNFVTQKQQHFYINNKPYKFAGTNMWYAVLLAAQNKPGKKRLEKELDFLKQNGVNNIRVLIGSQDGTKTINGVMPVHPAMQTAKQKYNEAVFKGMDFLIQQLEKRKMYAVFYFANNWEWSGGFLQYLNWNNKIDDSTLAIKYGWHQYRDLVSQFYTCSSCITDYFDFVKTVVKRTSTLTHKKYTHSPAIMAWEIANEPRPMRIAAAAPYINFIKNTAALIKLLDKNHLVTTGVEGYMGTENVEIFSTLHADTNINYATIHIWPKNWSWFKDDTFKDDFTAVINNTQQYIYVHDSVMQQIQKPLVLEEFGLPRDNFLFTPGSATTCRNQYYSIILQALATKKYATLSGINFWAFAGFGKPAKNNTPFWKEGDDLIGDPPMEEQGLNAVFAADTATWKIIKKYTTVLNK